jgi:hypothetical protein
MRKASKKFAITIISLVFLATLPKEIPAIAQQRDLRQFVDSIKSVEQVKKEIGRLISAVDNCKVGSCFNFNSTAICELVAALDVQVNGQIVGGMTSIGSQGKIPISKSDLSLMRDIFSQCKPTNYQYWNFESMLHVYYVPKPELDQKVRQALGLPPSKRRK